MAKKIGTVFVELDLDASRYTKAQQKLRKDATTTSLNIEENFKKLGVKSSAHFDLMRAKITNSFNMIKNSSQATANDILRAEKSKNTQLRKLNEQQFGKHISLLQKLKKAYAAVKTNKFAQGLTSITKKLGSFAASVGKAIIKTAALGVAIVAAMGVKIIKSSITAFTEFETALVDMGKVTKQPLEEIKKSIMALPPEIGTATNLMKGYYQVISAGVTEPIEAIELLTTASKTAKAAHVEQSETIKGLTKLMAGYEGEIRSAAEAADLLFTIEKEGQTSVAELIPVIGGLAKISKDMEVSANEMAGALATVTLTAGTTSEAATRYEAVLIALMKPTTAMKGAIKDMGYETAQLAVQDLGLIEVLKQLKESTGGSANKLAELFGRKEALVGISALASNSFATLTGKIEVMADKTGAASKAWDEYKGTLAAIWETFKATIGKQLIMIGEQLAPAIKKVVEQLGAWLDLHRGDIAKAVGEWWGIIVEFAKELKPIIVDLVGRFQEWYGANKDQMQANFAQYLENVATAIKLVADNVTIALVPFTALGKVLVFVGDRIADVMIAFDKLWKKIPKSVKIMFGFTGTGSTELPITEKIDEVQGKFADLSSKIEDMQPQFTVDVSPTMRALDTVNRAMNDVARAPGGGLTTSEWNAALKGEGWTVKGQGWTISQKQAGMAALVKEGKNFWGDPLGTTYSQQVLAQRGTAGERVRLQNQKKNLAAWWEMPAEETHSGTGSRGLPKTGLYLGLKGEIVKSPEESKAERRGQSGNTFQITFAPTIMSGNEADMRKAARLFKKAIEQEGIRTN